MTPYHQVLNKCWENGIYVRIKPSQRGYLKNGFPVYLNLEKNKMIVQYGQYLYNQNSKKLEETMETIYRNEYAGLIEGIQ